jgi:phenylalanyl-tRNA synthetase alpha chain
LEKDRPDGYLITADVYRRDEIDPTHYPVFHQMEGICLFDRDSLKAETNQDPKSELEIDDKTTGGPIQDAHSTREAEILGAHLKSSLESLVRKLFCHESEELQVRWIEAYFPFTSPSWEMEVLYRGKWLELLGCGGSFIFI